MEENQRRGVSTPFARLQAQTPQCWVCEEGVSCRMCYMGPCRILGVRAAGKATIGVCGATADTIVARNLLRETIGGAASHTEHALEMAEALLDIAEGRLTSYTIKDAGKLIAVAKSLGVPTEGRSKEDMAKDVATIALNDIAKYDKEPMAFLKAYAPKSSYETWKKLDIIPSGAMLPIMNGMHRTSMGNDADPVNILLADLKLGLVDGYGGLTIATELSDIIFGTPKPVHSYANLGTIKEDYVNIAVHGHNPMLSEKILEVAERLEPRAREAGAKGINIVGVCCTGNELLMREGVSIAANEMQAESVIATGALEAMVVDFQCIWPILGQVASCYHTKLITTMPYVKIPGALHIEFSSEHADEIAEKIVGEAIAAYSNRDPARVNIPSEISEVFAGFSVEAIVGALSRLNPKDPLEPLITNIVNGNIYGVVGIVGCPNPKERKKLYTERLVKGLLKNNVMVIVTGCTAHITAQEGLMDPNKIDSFEIGAGLKAVLKAVGSASGLPSLPAVLHMGSCVDNSRIGVLLKALSEKLGVKVSDLPVVASAPELITEKAVAIGTWALDLGVSVHVAPALRIEGSKMVTEVLTKGLKDITGSVLIQEEDPDVAIETILGTIREKRLALKLNA
ncbi:MAG TPA: anaerobic carbon-monoxide dehydrogenase catalytic subunit [Nitrososphaerales archaeon]|nr:anaerobic carbon-monoxide dehydrogenase catalytic subunit [Nitrososphaerales archaeon]HUK75682.1 anaerobic carbon-monoxide dehydrogenase catalytic subunit [Nitrososphaerales archaeon]